MITQPSEVLAGGGEMGALMRTIDWSTTPVGPVAAWPQSLRTALSILLETGFPMYIAWGPDFTQFYNDGYRPILGSTKHPAAMGRGTRETFAEIWDIIGPMFAGVMQGTPTTVVDFMLPLDRHGFSEECYFIFSYSPIRQENGQVGGVLVTVTESTQRVVGERRLKATQGLAARTREAKTVHEACAISGSVLAEHSADIPFALIYLLDPQGNAVLEGFAGSAAIPACQHAWLCHQANRARGPSRRCFARAKQSSSMLAASLPPSRNRPRARSCYPSSNMRAAVGLGFWWRASARG